MSKGFDFGIIGADPFGDALRSTPLIRNDRRRHQLLTWAADVPLLRWLMMWAAVNL